MSGRLRRIAIDVTPLRVSHDFRLLWTGSLISALGSQFVRVGLYIQVYALTASPAQVGLLGVSALVGNVAGTFVGGSFIDAHDRRLELAWTQGGHHRLIRSTFVIDLIAMIFGMPAALFPVLAVGQFHRGPEVVGLLFAAPAVGALAQLLVAGSVTRIRRQGQAVIWSVAGWGAAIAAFGSVGAHLAWALLFLAIAGAADVVSAIFRSTILQVSIPDALRGRLGGIFLLVVSGGPRIGDLEAGLVAAAISPTFSVVSGGLACIVGAVACAVRYPELRGYDAGSRPPAIA